jgi:hypothetical protein
VALVRTDVSEECIAPIIIVERISELVTTLAVTSNRSTLRGNYIYSSSSNSSSTGSNSSSSSSSSSNSSSTGSDSSSSSSSNSSSNSRISSSSSRITDVALADMEKAVAERILKFYLKMKRNDIIE